MLHRHKLRVFISYARPDHAFAEKLDKFLRESECEPWLDTKSMLAGTRWELVIEQRMVSADLIIAIVSSNSATKEGYVQRELRMALRIADEKLADVPFLVPVLTEEMQLPVDLSRFSWVETADPDFNEKLFQALMARAAHLGRLPPRRYTQTWDLPAEKIGPLRKWVRANAVKEVDLDEIVAIARRLHPTHPKFKELDVIFRRWFASCPDAFHFIVVKAGNRAQRIGYTCVLPLSAKTYREYSSGRLSEWSLGLPKHPILHESHDRRSRYLLIQSIEMEAVYRKRLLGDLAWFHTLTRHLATFNSAPIDTAAEIVADGNVIGEQMLSKSGFRKIGAPESGATADPRPLFQLRFRERNPTASEKHTINVLAKYMHQYGQGR